MKKLEKRALLCLLLAAVLLLGTGLYVVRYVRYGGTWATFYANQHIYTDGVLGEGRIYDRNGVLLLDASLGTSGYSSDYTTRRSTAHAVGDLKGNVSTSAISAFKDQLVGYDLINGTYNISGRGNDLKLSIDASANKVAYQALAGRKGLVAVYNYETGEVVCMVSSPSFDPMNMSSSTPVESGTYINKFLSSTYTPGSIFKLVTSAAAIENLDNLDSWSYTCTGTRIVNGEKITCHEVHGKVDFYGALAHSCNCAFSELTEEIGAEIMEKYVKKLGLTNSYSLNGVSSAAGSFEFSTSSDLALGWAGIGQWKDQINPCSMLVYMGAIARDGKSVVPKLLHSAISTGTETSRMIKSSTATQLKDMMKNNVRTEYGESNFPGLDIYAKSGTAENSSGQPNAWFAGFIANEDCPYAFIVCVENGGYGSSVAGPVANQVLQYLVSQN